MQNRLNERCSNEMNHEYYAESRMNSNRLIPAALSTQIKQSRAKSTEGAGVGKAGVTKLETGRSHYDVSLKCHVIPPWSFQRRESAM